MDITTIIVTVVTVLGSLGAIPFTYALNANKELEAEWRKEKILYYKDFVESLSGIIEGEDTLDGHRAHGKAANNLMLFAPQKVLETVEAYKTFIADATRRDKEFMEEHNYL